jgi:hypothetical protein
VPDEPKPIAVAAVTILLVVAPLASLIAPRATSIASPAPIDGYRVAYLIEDFAGERRSARTEVVEVRRPYSGRLESRSGRPPGGEITSGRVSNREFGWQIDDGGELQFGIRRPSGGPTRDVSYAALVDAADAGAITAGPRGSALKRTCTWFMFKAPFPEHLAPPTSSDRVEACVDPAGILLRETWVIKGAVARTVEAVALDPVAPSGERFLEGKLPDDEKVTQPDAADLAKRQVVVGDDVDDERPVLGLSVPDGWRADRNARVVQAGASGRPTQFASQTFVRGNELVIVEIGMKPEDEPTWQWNEGGSIDVPDAAKARVLYFGDRVEVRLLYDDGFARILAPTRAIARSFARLSGD